MIQKEKDDIRANDSLTNKGREIYGYAIVFNTWSINLGGFKEKILPSALSQSFVDASDVKAVYQHSNVSGILARSNKTVKTLKLTVDSHGLAFSFIAKDTNLGNEVLSMVQAKEITQASFSFRVEKEGESWEKDSAGLWYRTVSKISLLSDISPVLDAAYTATQVGSRFYQETILAELAQVKTEKETTGAKSFLQLQIAENEREIAKEVAEYNQQMQRTYLYDTPEKRQKLREFKRWFPELMKEAEKRAEQKIKDDEKYNR
jgi:HK97 family phage prohead protease